MELTLYQDILASVRNDNNFHSITSLVQPDWPEVQEIAEVLMMAPDFIAACHEFVHTFTTFRREIGDFWTTPEEMLANRAGDCDDKAILLVSLLRNKLSAEEVFCAFGFWGRGSRQEGHMWVVVEGPAGADRILESTADPAAPHVGKYFLEAMFNDKHSFAIPAGIHDFNLLPVAVAN